jgi:hypothetical protein
LLQLRLGAGDLTRVKADWLRESIQTEYTVRGYVHNLSNYWQAMDLLDSRGSPVITIDQARSRYGIGTITGKDSSYLTGDKTTVGTLPGGEEKGQAAQDAGAIMKAVGVGLGLLALLKK